MPDKVFWKDILNNDLRIDASERIASGLGGRVIFDGSENLDGFCFAECDMSLFEGLTEGQFLSLESINKSSLPYLRLHQGAILPECEESDLSRVFGLGFDDFKANAEKLIGARLFYMNFDGSESLDGMDLSDMDFSNVTGHRLSQFKNAGRLNGVKFGRAVLFYGDSLDGVDFTDCDLSRLVGATGEHFNGNIVLDGAKMPKGDFRNFSMKGREFFGTDFTQCRFSGWRQINEAASLEECKIGFIAIRKGDLRNEFGEFLPVYPKLAGCDLSRLVNLHPDEVKMFEALGALNMNARMEVPKIGGDKSEEIRKRAREVHEIAKFLCMRPDGSVKKITSGWRRVASSVFEHAKKRNMDPYSMARALRGLGEDEALERFNELKRSFASEMRPEIDEGISI